MNIKTESFFNEETHTAASNDETAFLMHSRCKQKNFKYEGSHVCQTLDFALTLAENALIAWKDPDQVSKFILHHETNGSVLSEADEKAAASYYMGLIFSNINVSDDDVQVLFSYFEREVYTKGDTLWRQGSKSDCAKLLVCGKLIAMLENEAGTYETVQVGRMVGELGLVAGVNRMNSLECLSDKCVVYSISSSSFKSMVEIQPKLARIIDLICIEYLSDRVQHVSNRIFETRCLPI
jgi:SulP family sulfate permease